MRKWIVGVMGPGESARAEDLANAFELGKLIAQEGWVLLSGGRAAGVMDAVNKGAKDAGGLTLGVLDKAARDGASSAVDIAILTGMGSARNNINVLSSDAVIACGMAAGTASETALALKAGKKVILLNTGAESERFFQKLVPGRVLTASSAAEAVEKARGILGE
jgi:uncharacterized protein (TIGR00725 family)